MSESGYVLDTNIIIERGSYPPDSRVVRWFDSLSRDRLFLTPPVYEEMLNGIDETDRENPARQRKWLEEFRGRYGWLDLPQGRSVIMTEDMAGLIVEHSGNIPRTIYVDFL